MRIAILSDRVKRDNFVCFARVAAGNGIGHAPLKRGWRGYANVQGMVWRCFATRKNRIIHRIMYSARRAMGSPQPHYFPSPSARARPGAATAGVQTAPARGYKLGPHSIGCLGGPWHQVVITKSPRRRSFRADCSCWVTKARRSRAPTISPLQPERRLKFRRRDRSPPAGDDYTTAGGRPVAAARWHRRCVRGHRWPQNTGAPQLYGFLLGSHGPKTDLTSHLSNLT
jgi:hypothetical protein